MISLPPASINDESEKLAIALRKQKDRHRLFKKRFLANLSKIGLLMETVCVFFSIENKLLFFKGCSRK
jgi:hypothetical protein